MAVEYTRWITECGSFNIAEKKALVNAFRDSGGAFTPTAAPTALTNNTGGTPNNTLVAITVTEPANLAAQTVINTAIRDNITDLAAKVNEIRAALVTAGILT